MDLAEECYRATKLFPKDEMYGMTSQIRRAAASVAANIAEGHGREHTGSFVQSLRVAQGSLKELETHVILAQRVGLLVSDTSSSLLTLKSSIKRTTAVSIEKVAQLHSVSLNAVRTWTNIWDNGSHPVPTSVVPLGRAVVTACAAVLTAASEHKRLMERYGLQEDSAVKAVVLTAISNSAAASACLHSVDSSNAAAAVAGPAMRKVDPLAAKIELFQRLQQIQTVWETGTWSAADKIKQAEQVFADQASFLVQLQDEQFLQSLSRDDILRVENMAKEIVKSQDDVQEKLLQWQHSIGGESLTLSLIGLINEAEEKALVLLAPAGNFESVPSDIWVRIANAWKAVRTLTVELHRVRGVHHISGGVQQAKSYAAVVTQRICRALIEHFRMGDNFPCRMVMHPTMQSGLNSDQEDAGQVLQDKFVYACQRLLGMDRAAAQVGQTVATQIIVVQSRV